MARHHTVSFSAGGLILLCFGLALLHGLHSLGSQLLAHLLRAVVVLVVLQVWVATQLLATVREQPDTVTVLLIQVLELHGKAALLDQGSDQRSDPSRVCVPPASVHVGTELQGQGRHAVLASVKRVALGVATVARRHLVLCLVFDSLSFWKL